MPERASREHDAATDAGAEEERRGLRGYGWWPCGAYEEAGAGFRRRAFWTFGRAWYVSGIRFLERVCADIGAGSLLGGGKSGGGKGLGKMGIFTPGISVFIGQGDEGSAMAFTAKNSPIKSGFWIGDKDKFNVMSEAINYDNVAKDMYISMEYEYLPMPSRPKEYYDVGMGAINVSPCSSIAICEFSMRIRLD